jgi:hypothetical protein
MRFRSDGILLLKSINLRKLFLLYFNWFEFDRRRGVTWTRVYMQAKDCRNRYVDLLTRVWFIQILSTCSTTNFSIISVAMVPVRARFYEAGTPSDIFVAIFTAWYKWQTRKVLASIFLHFFSDTFVSNMLKPRFCVCFFKQY